MKKIKKNYKFILGILLGLTIGSIGVYASQVLSKDIGFTPTDSNWDVTNVEDAINDLYKSSTIKDLIIKIGTNNNSNGVETYEVERDCDNAIIIAGQSSFRYSINSDSDYHSLTLLGSQTNNVGFYYQDNISLKKGDIIYFKRNTSGQYAYAIIY